jgi:hypothetical protein
VASPTEQAPDTTMSAPPQRATMDDVTTAVLPQSDWTRTLLTPLRAPAWRVCLYFMLISNLATPVSHSSSLRVWHLGC